jgi:protein-S-isoprenylcysteine O-methyltransferase Ste14
MRVALKSIAGILMQAAIFVGLLLLPARAWTWWRAWVFIAVMAGTGAAISIGVFRRRPDLLDERFKPPIQRGQPSADRVVLILLVSTFCGAFVFIPLDVFRFHLLGKPGPLVSALGLALIAGSAVLMYLSFQENAFAAPVVRHQSERGHTVIDTGVYSVVRHPLYASGILLMIGVPLWLGSYAAVLLAGVPVAWVLLRIRIEERFLRRELEGYDAYTRRVRHRLIPRVW